MNTLQATIDAGGIALAKNASYAVAFILSLEYFGFRPESIYVFATLMMIDVVTGVIRSSIVDGGKSIRSSTLQNGLLSKLLLMLVPFTIALAGKGVGFEMQGVAQGAVTILILSEAYSIVGNIHSALTRKPKQEYDAVALILSGIKSLLEKVARP